jgi:energy-coupling factor transporter ATP-binding protein EcfA2
MIPARDNPFSTDRVLKQRYRFSEKAWSDLLQKLAHQRGRGALVGPKGSGKTTLLEDMKARLQASGFHVSLVRLTTECPRWPAAFHADFLERLGTAHALLIDGAEQLTVPRWWWLRWHTRSAGIVVVTTHHRGRLPLLHRCTTTPELLQELASSLDVEIPDHYAHALHRHHGGNIREALRALYDEYSQKDTDSLFTRNLLSR